jgi:hypothetical protein
LHQPFRFAGVMRMREENMSKWWTTIALRLLCLPLLWTAYLIPAWAQQSFPPQAVPADFDGDKVFAEDFRARILPFTEPATARYPIGNEVLDRLTEQLPPNQRRYSWKLRIAKNGGNVLSSPDGTIFVDEELARFLGLRTGLWAAALSHEIEHVVRRDWARRYLFRKSLQKSAIAHTSALADASGMPWLGPNYSSIRFEAFCQSQELEADSEGSTLMARAGFHPDFMPALYHFLQAQPQQLEAKLLDTAHPGWEERYENLQSHSAAAVREFSRLWPNPYSSPGGDPPVVIYTGAASVHRASNGELEVQVHVHCENMHGTAKVILRLSAIRSNFVRELSSDTVCTSNKTVLTFTIANSEAAHSPMQGLITIMDDQENIVTRSFMPKLIR